MKKTAAKAAKSNVTVSKPTTHKVVESKSAKDNVEAKKEVPVEVVKEKSHEPIESKVPVPVPKPEPVPENEAVAKTSDDLYNEIKAAIKGASAEKKIFLDEQIGSNLSLKLQAEGYFTHSPSAQTNFKTMISWS